MDVEVFVKKGSFCITREVEQYWANSKKFLYILDSICKVRACRFNTAKICRSFCIFWRVFTDSSHARPTKVFVFVKEFLRSSSTKKFLYKQGSFCESPEVEDYGKFLFIKRSFCFKLEQASSTSKSSVFFVSEQSQHYT